MLTTLEALRDTESVKEMPRAVITSLDAFLHGRVGDLYIGYRALMVLSTIATVAMGLSDFARVSTLFASTLDSTKPLYQQMSTWHYLFRQLRGSLVPPTPGVPHPVVSAPVELQFLVAQLRAFEASSTSPRDQMAAQSVLSKGHQTPDDLLSGIRVFSEGSSHMAPCFQSTGVSSAPANGHAHGALSGAGNGSGGGASGGLKASASSGSSGGKGSTSSGSGGGGGSSGGASKHAKHPKATPSQAAPLPVPPSQPAPPKQSKGANANAGGGTPAALPPGSKKSQIEQYHSLVDTFCADVPELNTEGYVETVDFGNRTVPRWICAPDASGQNPLFVDKEAFTKLSSKQRKIVLSMRASVGYPTSNEYISGLSQARLITARRTFAAQLQPLQHSQPSQQYAMPPTSAPVPQHGGHLLHGSQQQSFAPTPFLAQGFAPQQHAYPQQFQSSASHPLEMQQQASAFYGQHVPPPQKASQQPMHPQHHTMYESQQQSFAPVGHPGGHYGVPPPGFAQSFATQSLAAQPFRSQQQQQGRPQQWQPPFITTGPAPGELPNAFNGPWRHGDETSGSATGF